MSSLAFSQSDLQATRERAARQRNRGFMGDSTVERCP
jgi:hypothetical protein